MTKEQKREQFVVRARRISERINLAELKSRLRYEPATGQWFWLKGRRAGKQAARLHGNSRGKKSWMIWIDYIVYPSSHLAFFYMTGQWPADEMDHINRDAADDRWINLRPATRAENEWNKDRYSNNRTGYKGVYPVARKKHKKFEAAIRRNGQRVRLGFYETAAEAAVAYQTADHTWQQTKSITSA